MRDKHYKIFAQRLSEQNINWLKQINKDSKSWNLTFNYLKKLYDASLRKMPRE